MLETYAYDVIHNMILYILIIFRRQNHFLKIQIFLKFIGILLREKFICRTKKFSITNTSCGIHFAVIQTNLTLCLSSTTFCTPSVFFFFFEICKKYFTVRWKLFTLKVCLNKNTLVVQNFLTSHENSSC